MKIINFRLVGMYKAPVVEYSPSDFVASSGNILEQKELWADLVDKDGYLMCTASMTDISKMIKKKLVNNL